jgi:peptidyl-prolyl cis-trans isomerase SurA
MYFQSAEGEISAPLKLILISYYIYSKNKGSRVGLRHILLTPTVTDDVLTNKRENNFDQERIEDKELTFADAARKFSDEKKLGKWRGFN